MKNKVKKLNKNIFNYKECPVPMQTHLVSLDKEYMPGEFLVLLHLMYLPPLYYLF